MVLEQPRKEINGERILYEVIAFAVFLIAIYATSVFWQDHIKMTNDYKSEPTTAVIYDKIAQKSLYGDIYYYAVLEPNLIDQTVYSLSDGQKSSLTLDQFELLTHGDRIDGFNIDQTFYVQADIEPDFYWFWIILAFVIIYSVCYIIYLLTRIKKINDILEPFFNRHDRALTYIINIILFGGLTIGLLFSFYSFGGAIKNAYDRVTSTDLVETIAEVTDKNKGTGWRDIRYHLALSYDNERGEPIQVTKEVTSNTFYSIEDEIPIKFKKDNPYNVFTQNLGFKDVFNIFTSTTMVIYYLTFIISALLLLTVYLLDKKRRTGSN